MTDTLETPRLFISYSWTSPQHQQWVLNLAKELRGLGVDAILDKWDLKEGHDAIKFMEGMVTDSSIDKVMMIVDKNYAEKADAREGGVGTETQIISKKIYEQQDQEKFVAIALEKDDKGKPLLPVYCQSRICIDFSEHENPEKYDKLLKDLLRWIFDAPDSEKPPIGPRPAFLSGKTSNELSDNIPAITPFLRAIEAIKEGKKNVLGDVEDYLETLSFGMEGFRINVAEIEGEFDDAVIDSIENFIPYRAEFIELLLTIAKYSEADNCIKILHKFFERLIPYLYVPEGYRYSYRDIDFDNFKFIIHELFLYTIAILLKAEKFEAAHYLISKDYYSERNARRGGDVMVSYDEFCNDVPSIRAIRNSRLELNRISLQADLLQKRAQDSRIDFKYIMQADFVLLMRKELISIDVDSFGWYPIPLLYAEWSHAGAFEIFARSESREYFDRIKPLLSITKKDDIDRLFTSYANRKKTRPRGGNFIIDLKYLMGFDKLATK